MAIQRPKQPTIYGVASDFWKNTGTIEYIAHAITSKGAFALGPLLDDPAGGSPQNHPDQLYWANARSKAVISGIQDAGGGGAIERIEIDCTLMPCDSNQYGCLYRVPQLINGYEGLSGKHLVIFSHRAEIPNQPGESSKRVIQCKAGDDTDALNTAMANNTGWGWVSWEDGQRYDLINI